MDRERRRRYILAIYLIVLSLAIIFLLVGFDRDVDRPQSVLLNLSTELLGVVFVFFLVNYLFLVDDWSLSERIEQLLNRLEPTDRPSAGLFFRQPPNINRYVQKAQQIDLAGVSLTSTISKQFSAMRERLQQGCHVRLMIIDPHSHAVEMAGLRSETRDANYFRRKLDSTFQDIEYLYKSWEEQYEQAPDSVGRLEIRLVPYPPSFGIMAFDAERPDGVAFVEIYPHKTAAKTPIFELSLERDGDWYQYFINQFEGMWKEARTWQPTTVTEEEHTLIHRLRQKARASEFFSSKIALNQLPNEIFANARQIFISGIVLSRASRQYMNIFIQRLEAGAHIRAILADSTKEAVLQQMSLRIVGNLDEAHWRSRLQGVETIIAATAETAHNGTLEIGHLPYLPSFGMIVIDPHEAHSICFVEIYHQRTADFEATFAIRAADDPLWYDFFLKQYDILWKSCRTRKLTVTSEESRGQ